jgi:hypothetical protein
MSPTFFVQECPICGRNLEVRVTYLGRNVVCQHCGGSFTASDGSVELSPEDSGLLLLRVEELLELTAVAGASSPPVPR